MWGLSEAGLKPKRLCLRPALVPRWVRHKLTAGASQGGRASNAGLFDLYSLQPQIAKNLGTAEIWRNATKVDHCWGTFLLQQGGKEGKGPPLRRPIVQNWWCRQIVHFLVSCLILFKIVNTMHENFHQNFPISCFQNCQCAGWTLCYLLFNIVQKCRCRQSVHVLSCSRFWCTQIVHIPMSFSRLCKTGGSSKHFQMSCFWNCRWCISTGLVFKQVYRLCTFQCLVKDCSKVPMHQNTFQCLVFKTANKQVKHFLVS